MAEMAQTPVATLASAVRVIAWHVRRLTKDPFDRSEMDAIRDELLRLELAQRPERPGD